MKRRWDIFAGKLDFLREMDGKCNLGIVNFDAHFDLRPFVGEGNSGTMFRQIARRGLSGEKSCFVIFAWASSAAAIHWNYLKPPSNLGVKLLTGW
jgi:arginase family enzyme